MLGTPKNINFLAVKKDFIAIEGVEQAHTLNIWSISSTRTALAGHIVIRKLNYIHIDIIRGQSIYKGHIVIRKLNYLHIDIIRGQSIEKFITKI